MAEEKFKVYDEKGNVLKGHRDDGKVITDVPRPDPILIQRIAKYGAAKVAELMRFGGVMNRHILPIKPGFHMAGPAFTASGRPGDLLFPIYACSLAQPGDVLVFGGGGQTDFMSFGDGIGGYVKRRNIAGLVMDAPTHDIASLKELDLPMFCVGFASYGAGIGGPGAVNIPVACGDVVVNPGDIVIGDDDGVVVVPWQDAERMAAIADAQYEIDLVRRRKTAEGVSLIQLNGLEPQIQKWVDFQSTIKD